MIAAHLFPNQPYGAKTPTFLLLHHALVQKKKNALLPVPLLVLIIRYGDNILQEFFEKYLEQMVKNYLAHRGEMDRQFGKWLELSRDFSDMAGKAMSGIEPFRSMYEKASSPDKGRSTGDDKD